MFFKKVCCLCLMLFSCIVFARNALQLWNNETLSFYESVLSSDSKVSVPWTLSAIEVLEKVKNGIVTEPELNKLLNDRTVGHAVARECAEVVVLLYALRDNEKDYFLREYSFFQEEFPKSSYTSLIAPNKFLKKCPTCGGKCILSVNCNVCKNTFVCTTCKGKGVHLLGGMRSTKRRYLGSSSLDSDDDRSDSYSYSRSSRSSYRKTGSHTTRNYRGYVKEFVADTKEMPCVKCQGSATCVVCAPMRKKRTCKTCQTTGYIADEIKVNAMLKNVAEKGIKSLKGIKDQDVNRWQESALFKAEFQKIRTENDIAKIQQQVTVLLASYPNAVQRQSSERFLKYLRTLQVKLEESRAKQEEEARLVAADTAALKAAIQATEKEKNYYKRKEALVRLRGKYPKASNNADLSIALSLCEDEIMRKEDDIRNALRLLETLEDIDAGIKRVNQLTEEIDPVSSLHDTLTTVRADLIARKEKEKRKKQYVMIGIGLGCLILIYFLFDILHGIYQTQKNKRFY